LYKVFIYQDASDDIEFYGNLNSSEKGASSKINKALETLS
jgi:hypothetical protein